MKIDLGGGLNPKPGFVNVDRIESADVVCDISKSLPFDDDSVSSVYSSHCLEHLVRVDAVIKEIARVCRIGADVEFRLPHWLHETAMSPGHRNTLSEKFWSRVGDPHRHSKFFGKSTKGMRLVKVRHIPDKHNIKKAKLLFPTANDDLIMSFVPNCCCESRFCFTVEKRHVEKH